MDRYFVSLGPDHWLWCGERPRTLGPESIELGLEYFDLIGPKGKNGRSYQDVPYILSGNCSVLGLGSADVPENRPISLLEILEAWHTRIDPLPQPFDGSTWSSGGRGTTGVRGNTYLVQAPELKGWNWHMYLVRQRDVDVFGVDLNLPSHKKAETEHLLSSTNGSYIYSFRRILFRETEIGISHYSSEDRSGKMHEGYVKTPRSRVCVWVEVQVLGTSVMWRMVTSVYSWKTMSFHNMGRIDHDEKQRIETLVMPVQILWKQTLDRVLNPVKPISDLGSNIRL